MHRSILEGRVISAVERALRGLKIEDDFVEVKATWPDPKQWARQFAGAANRAAGSDLILIVGLNENDHHLTPPGDSNPETWWPQLQSRFEGGTAPDLVNNIVVSIPEGGSVTAMAFETDGAPYVIKSPDGKAPHFEVPIRTATGTGWAKRADLIRMLARRVRTPNAVALDSDLRFIWRGKKQPNPAGYGAQEEHITVDANLSLFIEHLAPDYVMLPQHAMSAEIEIRGKTYPMNVRERYLRDKDKPAPSLHGIEFRADGLLLTGPGRAYMQCSSKLPAQITDLVRVVDFALVRVVMPVTGNDAPVRVTFPFERSAPTPTPENEFHKNLGTFRLASIGSDLTES